MRLALAGVVLALVIPAVLVGIAATVAVSFRSEHDTRVQIRGVAAHRTALRQVFTGLLEAETGQRGFLLTGDQAFLAPYRRARVDVPQRLEALTKASYTDQMRVEARRLRAVSEAKLVELDRTVSLAEGGRKADALKIVSGGEGERLIDQVRGIVYPSRARDDATMEQLGRQADAAELTTATAVTAAGAIVLVSLVCGLWVIFSALRARTRATHDAVEAQRSAAASEARYRRLAETAHDIVTESSLDGIFRYVSAAALRITGYSVDELIGRSALSLVHEDDRPRVEAEIKQALAAEGGRAIEHRHLCKDGRVIWVESNPQLVRDPATGKAIAITDVIRDVTERRALAAQLSVALAEAEAAAAVKSEFLSNMSHELRTPLTSILGFGALLSEDPDLSATARRAVERIRGSSAALLTIVNDILDFSKLEKDQMEYTPVIVDPARMFENALGLMEPQAADKALTLAYAAETPLPALVKFDEARVRQVLLNLLGNAVKFTQYGRVDLIAGYDAEAQRLRCEVRDTGPGIGPEGLERLFKRFSQVDASTTRAFNGAGLGLAISKGLVEGMGGAIGVRSTLGEGSCFWFELPAEPTAVDAAVAYDAPRVDAGLLHGLRLLVTDDSLLNRELVRLMLEPMGVAVSEAASGENGVRIANEAPFDVILMDLRMPGMDGRAAADAIRGGDGPNTSVPILVFSADTSLDALDSAPLDGFDGAIAKPIVPDSMVAAIVAAVPYLAPDPELTHAA